jgi:hypothetical protein
MCHLRCDLCGLEFHRRDYYQRHLRTVHDMQDPGAGRAVQEDDIVLLADMPLEMPVLAGGLLDFRTVSGPDNVSGLPSTTLQGRSDPGTLSDPVSVSAIPSSSLQGRSGPIVTGGQSCGPALAKTRVKGEILELSETSVDFISVEDGEEEAAH